ncbi:MAG TPA: hypothetical protein VFX59_06860 [Polyangiales bacterium]|nr:hypothetical protein [Polyangiales bacterium]
MGIDLPTEPGSLRLDLHYDNLMGTQSESDRSGLELCIVEKAHLRAHHAGMTMSLTSFGPVLAPAGAVDKPITGTCKVTSSQPVHLLTAAPFAFTRARHMLFKVTKKNGDVIVMHDEPFQYGQQASRELDPEVVVEAGDTITTTCVYSNPTTRDITFGEGSGNEMCFNFALYYPKDALTCGFGLGV